MSTRFVTCIGLTKAEMPAFARIFLETPPRYSSKDECFVTEDDAIFIRHDSYPEALRIIARDMHIYEAGKP